MSINATFVQVDEEELADFRADPSSVEVLFEDGPLIPPAFTAAAEKLRERVRAAGPQMMADTLSRMDPRIREQLEQKIGMTMSALAAGNGGDVLLKLMERRNNAGESGASSSGAAHPKLSLDKAWHGVHYVLCGESEPGASLLSQAVLGGADLGDDDEGFSGYGPARYFTAARVAELARALSSANLEAQAAARFDSTQMSALGIYPGWQTSDATWVMDNLRHLRDFYTDAAGHGRAIVTCLV